MTDNFEVNILEYGVSGMIPRRVAAIRETGLNLVVNDRLLVRLACTGKWPAYLAAGFLYSCGVINQADDIAALDISEVEDETGVELEARVTVRCAFSVPLHTVTSGLGRHFQPAPDCLEPIPAPASALWHPAALMTLADELNSRCDLYRQTRGCHNASLCSRSGIVLFREDIGRHNAIDILVGQCLLEGLDTADHCIVSTGRIALEIVQKVVRARIPLLVSSSVATDAAVHAARTLGLSLAGNARPTGLWVYNNTGLLHE